jgi:hypothetical protein
MPAGVAKGTFATVSVVRGTFTALADPARGTVMMMCVDRICWGLTRRGTDARVGCLAKDLSAPAVLFTHVTRLVVVT